MKFLLKHTLTDCTMILQVAIGTADMMLLSLEFLFGMINHRFPRTSFVKLCNRVIPVLKEYK